jgi:hypothetical protein
MKIEKELALLKDYMGYFINLRHYKTVYDIRLKEWDGHGPRPSLNVRNVRDLEPLSFKDWIYYNKKTKK